MLNQNVEPKATLALNDWSKSILSRITERQMIHAALLELMPRDGSGVELKDLLDDVQALTDPVRPYVSKQSKSYPNNALRAAKQQWSCCPHQGRGWIDKDPETGLWSYLDGGLEQAKEKYDHPIFRDCIAIMLKVHNYQEPAVFEPAEVPEPIAACNVKEPTADVVTKDQDPDLADMIQQQINIKLEEIERLKKMLALYQGQDV